MLSCNFFEFTPFLKMPTARFGSAKLKEQHHAQSGGLAHVTATT
jgi:hypothetical protein